VATLLGGALAFAVLHALRRPALVAELFLGLGGRDRVALVVLGVVLVPPVSVPARELAVPLPIRRLVDAVDVDVAALADGDEVLDAVVGVVAVHMVEADLLLRPGVAVGVVVDVEPLLGSASADDARRALLVEDPLPFCDYLVLEDDEISFDESYERSDTV